ncbi:SCP domain-containing protein [Mycena kentingensis (nom. inval.)]|nr:SCP domain-containing protein [Mycena kentingensis (nom. inval.)]
MARTLAIAVLVGLLPSALAGPACAQKYKDTSECIQKCSTKWGYPGLMMGNDPWGSVMQTTGKTIDEFYLEVAKNCGEPKALVQSSSSSSAEAESETGLFRGNLGTQDVPTTTSATSSTLRFITSSRATTSSTKSSTTTTPTSTKPKPTTTSTTKKLQTTTLSSIKPVKTNGLSTTSGDDDDDDKKEEEEDKSSSSSSSNSGNSNSGSTSSNSGSSSGANGSRASDADVQAYLKGHNTIRAQHGAKALVWSNAAAEKAQEWADKCLNVHSGGALGPLGENLAAGTGSFSIAQAVKAWTDESSEYDPRNPQFSHFTQVVWKATTQVGCAVQTCDGIFSGFGAAQYYVCEYSVQGNVAGQFDENVQA